MLWLQLFIGMRGIVMFAWNALSFSHILLDLQKFLVVTDCICTHDLSLLEKYGVKNTKFIYNHKYLSSFQKLYQCEIKLQTKTQITQQHNKSKLKNTYSIEEIIVKGKI